MIVLRIKLVNDDTDWFPGECEVAALPAIGTHVRVMDRNSNMWRVLVTDVQIEARPLRLKEEWPSLCQSPPPITIVGEGTPIP